MLIYLEYLNKLGMYLSPISSFLQRNEYFKGVPIYIVQLKTINLEIFSQNNILMVLLIRYIL